MYIERGKRLLAPPFQMDESSSPRKRQRIASLPDDEEEESASSQGFEEGMRSATTITTPCATGASRGSSPAPTACLSATSCDSDPQQQPQSLFKSSSHPCRLRPFFFMFKKQEENFNNRSFCADDVGFLLLPTIDFPNRDESNTPLEDATDFASHEFAQVIG